MLDGRVMHRPCMGRPDKSMPMQHACTEASASAPPQALRPLIPCPLDKRALVQ